MPKTFIGSALGAAVAVFAGAAPVAAQDTGAAGERGIGAGVYTEAQAARGKAAFDRTCAACHPTSTFTAGHLRLWRGRTLHDWIEQIRSTMPFDNPGGLSRAEYVDILAYIIQLNDYPAGAAELPTDTAALKAIRIEVDTASSR